MIPSFPGRRRGSWHGSTIDCVRLRRGMAYCFSMSRAPANVTELTRGSMQGAGFRASWKSLRKQRQERGVILAVCSKNNAGTAEAVFHDHPEMLLRRSDIAAFLANWDDKTENLKTIATQLNIGIDSLVFVDDNPVERARIRESLPMVAVPELPEDTAQYVRCLADAGYFEAVAFTSEDRDRARQYAANAEREALLGSAESMGEFLRGLNMSVVFGPFTSVDHARVVQLINKTNQFNTTTRRYAGDEIARIMEEPDAVTCNSAFSTGWATT